MTEDQITETTDETTTDTKTEETTDTTSENTYKSTEKDTTTTTDDDSFDEESIDPEVKNYKPETPPTEEEDEVDPEDQKRISKIVEKEVGGKVAQLQKQIAVDKYFGENPEFNKYRGAAEKYLNHPTYSNIPVKNIVAIVAANDMQKIGAAKERAAAKVVAETRVPGNNMRKTTPESFNWSTVSKEEFTAQKAKVLGRPVFN